MRKQHLLKTMLLLCALIVGSSSAWADDINVISENFSTNKTSALLETAGWSLSGKITVSSGYLQIASGSGAGSATTPAFSTLEGTTATLTVTHVSSGSASRTLTITGVGCKVDGKTSTTVTVNGSSSGANTSTITITEATTTSKITFEAAQNQGTKLNSVIVYYTSEGGGGGSTVSAPSFNPGAGAVAAGTKVSIIQAEADAIRYTTDGTDPTGTTGTVYSAPITITTATTIKAIAIKGEEVSSVATAAYTITVAAPTFSLDTGSYLEGTTVTITSEGNTIYYTTDGSTPNNTSTEYTDPIPVAAGKNTYKAIAYDAYGNSSNVTTRTYTGIAPATLPFSWTGTSSKGKADLEEQDGVILSLGGDYAASNAPYRLKFDGTNDKKYVMIYLDEKPEAVSFTVKLLGGTATSGSKMKVQASADGINFTDIEEFTIKGDANAVFEFTTSNAFASTDRVVKLGLSVKEVNVGVGSINVTGATAPITITATGYNTFSYKFPLDLSTISEGATAYVATGVEDGKVKLEKTTAKVPAGTGLFIKGTANGNYTIGVTSEATAPASNLLVGAPNGTTVNKAAEGEYNYVFGWTEVDNPGFYLINATPATLPAGKAYLHTTSALTEDLSRLGIILDDGEVTGVADINRETITNNGSFFDLQGRRVANPTKGLYIINGKKVVIK